MGQKVNPVGLRLGINRGWDSVWYAKKNDLTNITIIPTPTNTKSPTPPKINNFGSNPPPLGEEYLCRGGGSGGGVTTFSLGGGETLGIGIGVGRSGVTSRFNDLCSALASASALLNLLSGSFSDAILMADSTASGTLGIAGISDSRC